MKNYVQKGLKLTFQTDEEIESGAIVEVGSLVGVSAGNYAVDSQAVIELEGVYSLPKGVGAITAGTAVYNDEGEVTATAGSNKFIGFAFEDAASDAEFVDVKLSSPGSAGAGSAPVAATVAALTDSSGGTANSTLQLIATGTPADLAAQGAINAAAANNFADLAAKTNAILTALKDAGLMSS